MKSCSTTKIIKSKAKEAKTPITRARNKKFPPLSAAFSKTTKKRIDKGMAARSTVLYFYLLSNYERVTLNLGESALLTTGESFII